MQILKRLLGGLIIVLFIGLAVSFISDPVITTRLLGLAIGRDAGPVEVVRGGTPAVLPVVPAQRRSIPAPVLQAAIEYGEATKSHALLVYHDGALQLEHYYSGHGPDTRTPTQSMHKSVLALLVGIAIRDGFIASVDDPAALYIKEWAQDERGRITVRQLLQQSSGIGFPSFGLNPTGGFFQVMVGNQLESVVLGQPLENEPGSRFDYNNINAQVLGIILERATGKRYAQYLSESLWQKLGTDDARVLLDSDQRRLARVFCCLDATARSWLQLGLLHLNGGMVAGTQVVPAEWLRDVTAPSALNANYGYLTWLGREYQERRLYNHKTSATAWHSEPFAAADVIYFDGFGGQRVYVVPSAGLVIVRTGAIATKWDDARLPNLILRGLNAGTVSTAMAR